MFAVWKQRNLFKWGFGWNLGRVGNICFEFHREKVMYLNSSFFILIYACFHFGAYLICVHTRTCTHAHVHTYIRTPHMHIYMYTRTHYMYTPIWLQFLINYSMHKNLLVNRLRDEEKGKGRISMWCGRVVRLIPGATILIENLFKWCDMCYCELVICIVNLW